MEIVKYTEISGNRCRYKHKCIALKDRQETLFEYRGPDCLMQTYSLLYISIRTGDFLNAVWHLTPEYLAQHPDEWYYYTVED